ncbi:hypothetical protein VTI28DRAFT_7903 [Corynascus sepedonium]
MYWQLKIKPSRNRGADAEVTAGGYWEVTRRDPGRISITIYRNKRPPNDPEPDQSQNTDPGAKSEGKKPTQHENNITNNIPEDLGSTSAADIHLVPPPPPLPPTIWTASVPLAVPFQPNSDQVHALPLQGSVGLGGVATSYIPGPPPPAYFGSSTSRQVPTQTFHNQHLGVSGPAPPRPASTPPPSATSSNTPSITAKLTPQSPPVTKPQNQWRRWFSLNSRPPIISHARTLSNSSSAMGSSRSSSPSTSSPRCRSKDNISKRASKRQPQSPALDDQIYDDMPPSRPRLFTDAPKYRHYQDSPSYSEPSYASSYINTSMEVFCGNQQPDWEQSGNYTRVASDPESQRDAVRNRDARIRHPDTASLASMLHRQHPARRDHRQRRPSWDNHCPSSERRQQCVSFTLPSDSDELRPPTSRSSDFPRRHYPSLRTRPSRANGQGYNSRRHLEFQHRKKRGIGLAERVTGTFYQMRRALRGEE